MSVSADDVVTTFLNDNPSPIFLLDTRFRVLYANVRGEEVLSEILDNELSDELLKLPSDEGDFVDSLKIPLITLGTKQFSGVLRRYHNNFLLFIYDVSQYMAMVKGYKESKERFQRLVENTNDIIYKASPEGFFTYVNPIAEKIVGYTRAELVGKHFTDLIREDYKPKVFEFYEEHFKKRSEVSYLEFPVLTKEGNELWVGQNVQLLERNGYVLEFTAVVREITKRKVLEQELLKALEESSTSALAKERFLANMSHEIRTPMNAIIGMARLLSETNLNQDQKEYTDIIIKGASNLLVIINDVLDISKIESGKLELEYIRFSLYESVKNIIDSIKLRAQEKGVELKMQFDEQLDKYYWGDPVRLNQILMNLATNAIKFTDKGYVEVGVQSLSYDQVQNTERIRFSVRDTGIGIAEEKLSSIFDPFTQEDQSTTRKFGGTGLGLSISKELVELYSSEILVESEKGVGTVFSFDLTLSRVEELNDKTKTQYDEYDLSGIHLLVAEDNEFNQVLIRTILSSWGVVFDMAADGEEALALFKQNSGKYQGILMDVQMPKLSGVEVTKIIRSELGSNIPILALTANALAGAKESFLEDGFNDYVSKPFEESILKSKLGKLCGVHPNGKKDKVSFQNYLLKRLYKKYNGNVHKLLHELSNNSQIVSSVIEEGLNLARRSGWDGFKSKLIELKSLLEKLEMQEAVVELGKVIESLSGSGSNKVWVFNSALRIMIDIETQLRNALFEINTSNSRW